MSNTTTDVMVGEPDEVDDVGPEVVGDDELVGLDPDETGSATAMVAATKLDPATAVPTINA